MSTYGVLPTGFVRKPLQQTLAEFETRMVATFGPGVIQTAQSPLGQINGLMADAIAAEWETLQDAYASFDVDQAENSRLDILAKLRRLERPEGEAEADFRLRITNQDQADISFTANLNRLRAIDGVTWASVRVNSTNAADDLGLPAHNVAYAVIGGDDEVVGERVYQLSVGGIPLFGNTEISVEADGYCQRVRFIRPTDVPIRVEVDVRHIPDACNCAPPSIGTIKDYLVAAFAGSCGYRNGDTVTADRVAVEAGGVGDIKVVEVRIAKNADLIVADELETTIFERPVILAPYVTIRYV
ncbi:hypothetical protein [Aurantimonas coralicida]|uniref:hypothetical protein n=1 Tax=Aurantimonas coralicida TaxID=182270 RepID=UPI001E28459B|nr:hypothetical protein [Aurantimonas coralicida]MCD1645238.1 hypothetical protein [Aurantimonas coralicida]